MVGNLAKFIPIVCLVAAALACNTAAAPTPTPIYNLPSNASTDCGDILFLRVRNVQVNQLDNDIRDAGSDTNQLRVMIILADDTDSSQFNYQTAPIPLQVGQPVSLGRMHAGIEINHRKPVYVWILVVDDDRFNEWEGLSTDVVGTLTGEIVQSASNSLIPGSGLITSFLTDISLETIIADIEQEDIIGDMAFMLEEKNNWSQGLHTYESPNSAVNIEFSIQRYPSCAEGLQTAAGPLSEESFRTANIVQQFQSCTSDSPISQIEIGNMVTVAVPSGRTLFFKPQPVRQSNGIRYAVGHIMRVIDGPECDGDTMYWQVTDWRGNVGWMAESEIDDATNIGVYFLHPTRERI